MNDQERRRSDDLKPSVSLLWRCCDYELSYIRTWRVHAAWRNLTMNGANCNAYCTYKGDSANALTTIKWFINQLQYKWQCLLIQGPLKNIAVIEMLYSISWFQLNFPCYYGEKYHTIIAPACPATHSHLPGYSLHQICQHNRPEQSIMLA